jgi:hypothetical protein
MKKLLFFPILLIFSLGANAQLFSVSGHNVGFIYVGPKVGTTFSTISNFSKMSSQDTKYRLGYQIGAVGEIGLSSKVSFQTEVLFYSRGTQMENSKIKMNYVGIPLLAKYSFKALGFTKLYAMAGTFADVRTKGVEEYSGPTANTGTVDLPEGFKKSDWGFSFGAGAEYPTKKGIWGLDFRYNLGMTDITDSSLGDVNTKSRSFGFSLTYKYDLTKLFSKSETKKETKK